MITNLSDWMLKIRDDRSLSELSIPGTHDTCARYGGASYQCQTWDLQTQLANGIRFFDIRCRHYQDKFTIHHAGVYQQLDFPDVRDCCIAFLQQHPSETILMSIKKETDDDEQNQLSFQDVFDNYLKGFENFWFLDNKIPTLGKVRGKIVLFRRFDWEDLKASEPRGIDLHPESWSDNHTFVNLNDGNHIEIQDEYKAIVGSSGKWDSIKKQLDKARISPTNYLFINFTSASIGGFPITFATGVDSLGNLVPSVFPINMGLKNYLSGEIKERYGIIIMDFPEYPNNALCSLILNMNVFDKISFFSVLQFALRNFMRFIIKLFR